MLVFGIKFSVVSLENQKEMFVQDNLENDWMDFDIFVYEYYGSWLTHVSNCIKSLSLATKWSVHTTTLCPSKRAPLLGQYLGSTRAIPDRLSSHHI